MLFGIKSFFTPVKKVNVVVFHGYSIYSWYKHIIHLYILVTYLFLTNVTNVSIHEIAYCGNLKKRILPSTKSTCFSIDFFFYALIHLLNNKLCDEMMELEMRNSLYEKSAYLKSNHVHIFTFSHGFTMYRLAINKKLLQIKNTFRVTHVCPFTSLHGSMYIIDNDYKQKINETVLYESNDPFVDENMSKSNNIKFNSTYGYFVPNVILHIIFAFDPRVYINSCRSWRKI